MKPLFPIPESAAADIKWKIVHDARQAYVNFETGIMHVPLNDAEGALATRCHELAHVKFSPREWSHVVTEGRCTMDSLQACEDFRVNTLAMKAGAMMNDGYGDGHIRHTCEGFIQGGDQKYLCLSLIAFGAIPRDMELTLKYLEHTAHSKETKVASYVRKQLRREPTFEMCVKMAAYVDGQYASKAGPPKDEVEHPEFAPGHSESSGNSDEDDWDWEDRKEEERSQYLKPSSPWNEIPVTFEVKQRRGTIDIEGNQIVGDSYGINEAIRYVRNKMRVPLTSNAVREGAFHQSGDMRIVTPDLPRMIQQKGSKQFVSVKEGCILHRPHMLLVNRHIFRGVSRHAPAAYLIDVSGSMNLEAKDVEAIVRKAPASIVATYCGASRSGDLTIVARNGRMASEEDMIPKHGGNVVDAPALEWLSKQKGRKVWVCDGIVTGIGDNYHPLITEHCERIRRRNRITRIRSIDEIT